MADEPITIRLRGFDVGVVVTLVIVIAGAVYGLGVFNGRLSSLESGGRIEDQKNRAIAEIQHAAQAALGNINRRTVLVSASKLWIDSGIDVAPGTVVRVSATGLVNLGIHRVVSAAGEDTRPPLPWTGPEGSRLPYDRPLYARRQGLLPCSIAEYGTLVMYFRPQGQPDPGKENPFPSGVEVVGCGGSFPYPSTAARSARIFFCVNDTVLRPGAEYRSAYVGTQDEIDKTYPGCGYTVQSLRTRWDRLVAQSYWDIWFDDNVGYFLVDVVLEVAA